MPDLSARFFILLTSSCAGLANPDVTKNETERVKFLRQAGKWAERARERKYNARTYTAQRIAVERTNATVCSEPENPADIPHTVSSRLEDFFMQRTALIMKAALAAELGDDTLVKEAEDLEAQLVRDNQEMLNAR